MFRCLEKRLDCSDSHFPGDGGEGETLAITGSSQLPIFDVGEEGEPRRGWQLVQDAVEALLANPHVIRSQRYLWLLGSARYNSPAAGGAIADRLIKVKSVVKVFKVPPPLPASLCPSAVSSHFLSHLLPSNSWSFPLSSDRGSVISVELPLVDPSWKHCVCACVSRTLEQQCHSRGCGLGGLARVFRNVHSCNSAARQCHGTHPINDSYSLCVAMDLNCAHFNSQQ